MNAINQIFDALDRWRHLPAYQLERRADIFFAVYLRAFLEQRVGVPVDAALVPEFPVRIGTIYPEVTSNPNQSKKIDYVALSTDRERAFFVELKTDSGSRRTSQDDYLLAAQKVGLPTLMAGVLTIHAATKQKQKYAALLRLLGRLDLLKHTDTGYQVSAVNPAIEVLYLQPQSHGPSEIGFAEFAEWLGNFEDPVSTRFQKSLHEWARVPAGEG